MLIRKRLHRFANRVYETARGIQASGLWVPKHRNILCVIGRPGGAILLPASNIVTNDGDQYYAQRGAQETPTNTFVNLYLSSVAWSTGPAKDSTVDDLPSVISGAESAPEASYPQTDDQDGDNTGAGTDVITWKYSYAAGDFNDSDIEAGAITVASETNWGGSTGNPILTGFGLTSFEKTASDTLTVYVNHTANGV